MEDKRLRWRCRRGMKELDLIFERFLDTDYAELGLAERTAFEDLVESPDPELYDWLLGRSKPGQPQFIDLVAKLQRHRPAHGA